MSDSSIGNILSSQGGRTFIGGSSGLDTPALISSLVSIRQVPIDRLEVKVSDNNAEIDALTLLSDSLTNIRDTLLPLRSPLASESAFSDRATLISGGDGNGANYFALSADSTADLQTYSIDITSVAREEISTLALDDATQVLTFSNINSTAGSFTANVTLGDDLATIAAAINGAAGNDDGSGNPAITASVVETSPGVQELVLSGIDAQDFGVATDLGAPVAFNVTENQTSQQSVVTINGIQITRNEKEIDLGAAGLATGVTLTLFQEPPAATTYTGEVIADRSAAQTAIVGFVDQVNTFLTFYNEQTARGTNGAPLDTAVLANDGNLRSARDRILEELFASVDVSTDASGRDRTLGSVGISLNSEGLLEIDATVMNTALNTDLSTGSNDITFSEVATLFQSVTGTLNTTIPDYVDGSIFSTIEQTQLANTDLNERIVNLNIRLEDYRLQLIDRFARMDQAVAQGNAIRDQLRIMTESLASG